MKNHFGTHFLFWLGALVAFEVVMKFHTVVMLVLLLAFGVNADKTIAGVQIFWEKIQDLYHGKDASDGIIV